MSRESFNAGDYVTIEELIDRYDLDVVLRAVADVCYDKSAHVSETWQDGHLSKAWERAGKRVYAAAASKPIKAVSRR